MIDDPYLDPYSPPSSDVVTSQKVRPWGPWASIGWTILAIVLWQGIQLVVFVVFLAVMMSKGPKAKINDLVTNGQLISIATLVSTPALLGLVALLVAARRIPVRDYLALTWPPGRQVIVAVVGLALLIAVSDTATYLLGREIVPPFMTDVYRTSWPPLLLVALIGAAPLGEETLIRGFLYRGIADSRWGPVAAIVISSTAWALLHVQYDFYGIGTIALMGVYLGVVRFRTSSLLLTMLLHALANSVATAELLVQLYWSR
jgi:membrane protease YdiL (CAAX protease family)